MSKANFTCSRRDDVQPPKTEYCQCHVTTYDIEVEVELHFLKSLLLHDKTSQDQSKD